MFAYFKSVTNVTERSELVLKYSQTSAKRLILVGNKIVDHSDVVGAPPVGSAPTSSPFST